MSNENSFVEQILVAWNYMNDSLRSEVFVCYDPETIACGCIYLGARLLQIPLPNKPAWYLVFGVSDQDINEISRIILSLYTRKKPDPEKLEKIVEELRKAHQEAKLKAKGLSSLNNQMKLSPASQPCSPRNGTKSPVNDVDKEKNDAKHNDNSKYKDSNHRKRRSLSPLDDDYQSSEGKKRNKTSSSDSATSHSPSPKRGGKKTPPRGFKESRHSRSRSRSKTRTSKKAKHRSSHKRKHSRSLSPFSPNHHSSKKSYKSKHSEKTHHARSRSRSPHERNHHTNSVHEKPHKSRKVKENHHSREKKRR